MTEKKIWFRRKRYGWGWYPANWKGWAATLVYVLLAVGGSYVLSFSGPESSPFWFLIYLVAVSVLFVMIAWKRGETPPRWQWGKRK